MNDRTRAEINGHATASTGHTRHRFCGISPDAPARTRTPLHALDAEADQPADRSSRTRHRPAAGAGRPAGGQGTVKGVGGMGHTDEVDTAHRVTFF